MDIFDNNIHVNGAGTAYQAFLDLADAAEKKDGMIGDPPCSSSRPATVSRPLPSLVRRVRVPTRSSATACTMQLQ